MGGWLRRSMVGLAVCGGCLGCWASAAGAAPAPPKWRVAAGRGIQELVGSGDAGAVSWDGRTGLWGGNSSPHWWQSGLAVLTLVRYAQRTHDRDPTIQRVLLRTYQLNLRKPGTPEPRDFIDRFMDDTGWWGLAWLAASQYELTERRDSSDASKFLSTAETDASYIARQPKPCGGIEWAMGYGPDTITNAEFVVLTAELSRYRGASGPFHDPHRAARWLDDARSAWAWLQSSGLIDVGTGEVSRDTISPSCGELVGGPVTYTQGEVAQALLTLGQDLHDPSYYSQAARFLRYTLSPASGFIFRGVLQDHCEPRSPNCSALSTRLDVTAFKGLFMQAVDDWSRTTASTEFIPFLRIQAQAIVSHDINGATLSAAGCRSAHTCQFGFSWARALSPMLITVGTQESALDALTAVLG
jgi:hypothetical protein